VKRRLVQALFVVLGLVWLGYTAFEFFAFNFGDGCDEGLCRDYRIASTGLVFWRGLCVAFILIFAYRIVRVEPDE